MTEVHLAGGSTEAQSDRIIAAVVRAGGFPPSLALKI